MPAIANIVLADALTVNHTFAPAKTSADYALLEDRSAGIYIGYNKLSFSLSRPKGPAQQATRNLKLSIKIETPKLEVVSNSTVSGISPAPTVSYRPTVEIWATFPERCQLTDRQDLLAYTINALLTSQATDAFTKYELPY